MKDFRRLLVAVLLMLAFTLPVLAGDVHVPGAPAPGDTQGFPFVAIDLNSPGERARPRWIFYCLMVTRKRDADERLITFVSRRVLSSL